MRICCISLTAVSLLPAQVAPAPGGRGAAPSNGDPQKFLLWEGGAPGATGDTEADRPSLTFYRALGRSGGNAAVIVIPGGAYRGLSMVNEGTLPCSWLNLNGVSAFLLKPRIAPYRHPIELGDAQRAIRTVRARAAEFGIDPAKIGVMGFSAGGHLAATAGTHFDSGKPDAADSIERASSRPDFMVLVYPVISFQRSIAGPDVLHAYAASGLNLLGDHPDQALLDDLSDELRVTPQTPPAFLVHGANDALVSVDNSVAMFTALRKAGVPAELHVPEKGNHGFGITLTDPGVAAWPTLMITWLKTRGIFPMAPASAPPSGPGRGGRGSPGANALPR